MAMHSKVVELPNPSDKGCCGPELQRLSMWLSQRSDSWSQLSLEMMSPKWALLWHISFPILKQLQHPTICKPKPRSKVSSLLFKLRTLSAIGSYKIRNPPLFHQLMTLLKYQKQWLTRPKQWLTWQEMHNSSPLIFFPLQRKNVSMRLKYSSAVWTPRRWEEKAWKHTKRMRAETKDQLTMPSKHHTPRFLLASKRRYYIKIGIDLVAVMHTKNWGGEQICERIMPLYRLWHFFQNLNRLN